MQQHPEQDLQITIAGYLDWALPADYWYTAIDHSYHGEARGATLRRMGVKRGVLDMLVFGPERFVGWLENKSLRGTLTPEQKVTIPMFRAFGHRTAVCRSLDDAVVALTSWGIHLRTEKLSTERIRRGFKDASDREFALQVLREDFDSPAFKWPESEQIGRRRRKAAT